MNTAAAAQVTQVYHCSECGKPAVVTSLGIQRSCSCNTTVIADCSSNLKGEGKLKS